MIKKEKSRRIYLKYDLELLLRGDSCEGRETFNFCILYIFMYFLYCLNFCMTIHYIFIK